MVVDEQIKKYILNFEHLLIEAEKYENKEYFSLPFISSLLTFSQKLVQKSWIFWQVIQM